MKREAKKIFNANLKPIEKYFPELAVNLKAFNGESKDYTIVGQGIKNITYKNSSMTCHAYDIKNPRRAMRDIAKDFKLRFDTSTIMVGLGLGHTCHEFIIKKDKQHNIIVIEPDLFLIWSALQIYDFSKWFDNGTLVICRSADSLKMYMAVIEQIAVIQDWFVMVEKYAIDKPLVYEPLMVEAYSYINNLKCNTGTIMAAGATIARNDIENLPYVLPCPGVADYKDYFKNKPAIIINTGPSLKKNLFLLQEKRNDVVIIAVAQALRILLSYDIRPDFICTVDYGKTNYEHFEGLMDSDVPLVALNRSYAPILQEYHGPKIIVASETATDTKLNTLLSSKGNLDQGGSVSHMALAFANHLGCAPIAIIGQDLALTDSLSHYSGADASGKVFVEDGQILWEVTDPSSHLKGARHGMGPEHRVPGYFGGQVLTNIGLAAFISSFEAIAKGMQDKLFNCTEGGANIKGFKKLSLHTYLNTRCLEPINKVVLITPPDIKTHCDIAMECLKEDIKNIESMIDVSKQALETCDQLREHIKDKVGLKKILADNERLSKEAEEIAKKNQLIAMSIFAESRQIQSSNLKVNGKVKHLLKDEEDLLTRIERNEIILKSANKASKELLPLYNESLAVIDDYAHAGYYNELLIKHNEKPFDFNMIDDFYAKGNWSRPLLELRKNPNDFMTYTPQNTDIPIPMIRRFILMKEKEIFEAHKNYNWEENEKLLAYNEWMDNALESGQKKDFISAMESLEQANRLYPDKIDALWGLATTKCMLNLYPDAVKLYDNLIDTHPDVIKFKFEKGLALINIKDKIQEGLVLIIDVMQNSKDYDFFFISIGDLYVSLENYKFALDAYNQYLEKFPYDITIYGKVFNTMQNLNMDRDAIKFKTKYIQYFN